MSTVNSLTTELSNLVSQAKRRNTELRQASEKSLDVLKTYSGGDEKAFFKQVSQDETFLSPFFIACATRNAKYCATAVQCLQQLTNARALPESQLDQVMDALSEATNLRIEIQLKILQCLTPLVQNYRDILNDQLIASLLQICARLQERKNNGVVINTASATFQQITVSFFDKVADHENDDKTETVQIENHQNIDINAAAYDALRIFIDLCHLIEKQPPLFLRIKELPETFALELLESILLSNGDLFKNHREFGYYLKSYAVPTLLRFFTEKKDFAVFVRVVRVLYLLLCKQLSVLKVECEVILAQFVQCLDSKKSPHWKRILCMEVFRGVCSDFNLVHDIYQEYDMTDDRRDAIRQLVDTFDRIASEDTRVIGAGPISTAMNLPLGPDGEPIEDLRIVGLSARTSTARVQCIDLLDKTSPPQFPDSYLHFLVLSCINSLSEGLAKTVIPKAASANSDTPSKDEQALEEKKTPNAVAESFVERCWAEMLSLYTTFFYSTMEEKLYHTTVRCSRKFAHSAGVLQLRGPRDSFMSLLGKFAVLVANQDNTSSTSSPRPKSAGSSVASSVHQRNSSTVNPSITTPAAGSMSESTTNSAFTSRNVSCCVNLLDLGYVLGPQLGSSWTIIVETMQYADALLHGGKKQKGHKFGLGGEFASVDSILYKMIESTKDYDHAALADLCGAVCGVSSLRLGVAPPSDKKLEIAGIGKIEEGDPCFLIEFLGEIGRASVAKFGDENWKSLADYLIEVMVSRNVVGDARLRAGDVLNSVSYQAMVDCERDDKVQTRVLNSLQDAIRQIVALDPVPSEASAVSIVSTEAHEHVGIVDNVVKIVDHCGGRLETGWSVILDITDSVFEWCNDNDKNRSKMGRMLVMSGFESIRLLCNDFLQSLPAECLLQLIDTLSRFCNQEQDLNISFSAISFFWTVCDHLRSASTSNQAGSSPGYEESMRNIKTQDDVLKVAKDNQIDALWMVALLRLTTIASNPYHPQVRNGAVQILFRVLDSHGGSLPEPLWGACQEVVVPTIMSIRSPQGAELEVDLDQEWIETVSLILNGICRLYEAFAPVFTTQDTFAKLWHSLISYLEELDKHGNNQPPSLSAPVYKGFDVVLQRYLKDDVKLPAECLQESWDFWSSRTTMESMVDPKVTQDALTALVKLHQPLYDMDSAVSLENINKSVEVLKKCAGYGALPPLYTDKDHLSPLQAAAISQISRIEVTNNAQSAGLVLCLISHLIQLPFLDHSGERPPSFIALCEKSLKLLLAKLDSVTAQFTKLVDSDTVKCILDSALVPMETKFECPVLRIGDDEQHSVQLWQLATTILSELVEQIHHADDETWELVLRGVVSIMSTIRGNALEHEESFEEFDVYMYSVITGKLKTPPQWFYSKLAGSLYYQSKLYLATNWYDSIDEAMNAPFVGSTALVKALARPKVAYLCIDELAKLAESNNKAAELLDLRATNVLRQYVCDRPLRGKMPMQKLLRDELIYTLKTHQDVSEVNPSLRKLLVQAMTVASNDPQILELIQSLL